VGPRASLDTEVGGKILCPCWGSNPDHPVVQPVVRDYTDLATPAPVKYMGLKNLYWICYTFGNGTEKVLYGHELLETEPRNFIWTYIRITAFLNEKNKNLTHEHRTGITHFVKKCIDL
jgi:hypothetical protein